MDSVSQRDLHVIGWLLMIGAMIFWIGALTPPYRQWMSPFKEYLQIVGSHRWQWYSIHACFGIATILSIVAVRALSVALQQTGERLFSELGGSAFLVASVLWLVSIAFRVTGDYEGGVVLNETGTIPEWLPPLHHWSGLVFAVFMVMAYLAEAFIGRSLMSTTLVAPWVATTVFYFGIAGAVGYCIRFPLFDPPLMMHVMPFLIGYHLIKT